MKNLNTKYIDSLPSDDSSNLEYTTQSRTIKGTLYWLESDLDYQLTTYRQNYAQYQVLKEDSTGTESNSRALASKGTYLNQLDEQILNLEGMQKDFKLKHLEILGREYVKPLKGSKMKVTNQEVDSDFVPKQR
jgi:hypothetical protein